MNLFKSLVFTDKGIDDLTTAAETGKTIEIKRGVLCGYNPPDDNQVYNPYRDASGVLDVDAVKSNINKYFAKSEALKATTTPTPYIEGIVKLKTVKKDNKNILSFALDFENLNFDHDVAVKFFGYESWAALIASEKELASDCKCLALLAQDDAGLEYIFAFAKLASGQQLQYPLALTEELTHRLHVDLYISINQSNNIVIKYTPEGLVEYSEFEQHVELANNTYAKKVDVYTKTESDERYARIHWIQNATFADYGLDKPETAKIGFYHFNNGTRNLPEWLTPPDWDFSKSITTLEVIQDGGETSAGPVVRIFAWYSEKGEAKGVQYWGDLQIKGHYVWVKFEGTRL